MLKFLLVVRTVACIKPLEQLLAPSYWNLYVERWPEMEHTEGVKGRVAFQKGYAIEQVGLVAGMKKQIEYRMHYQGECSGARARREPAHWIQSILPPSTETCSYSLLFMQTDGRQLF